MDPLPHDPRNLRELVEADLRRAARLIIKVQDEIDPQFRIASPEGDFHIAATLPSAPQVRQEVFHHLGLFMAWKQAVGFTLASELYEPDSVYCVGYTRQERRACLARISRFPRPWRARNFGSVEWLPDSSIDPMLSGLLPRGARSIGAADLAALELWFGLGGKFPVVNLATGEVGL